MSNDYFRSIYKKENILIYYNEKMKKNSAIGLDKISSRRFRENLKENIDIINRKVINNTYKFTKYRQVLISKGEEKPPRVISIPTIRDSLVLGILNEFLRKKYGESSISKRPQLIINDIIKAINEKDNFNDRKYDTFKKIDIKSYYKSINHQILKNELMNKIDTIDIIDFIFLAINTETISIPVRSKQNKKRNRIKENGIPEGLSISNSIANIYLKNIDEKYINEPDFKYFRYVDDILILCKHDERINIYENIKQDLLSLKLETNEKEDSGSLSNGFDYLGYRISSDKITVRESSILRLEQNLEKLFVEYKRSKEKNIKLLEFKLNLRITGFIYKNMKYGWMFFFSQMDDKTLLSKLDWLVKKLSKRYKLDGIMDLKKFKRTKYEIDYKMHKSKYIKNFDKYDINDKKELIEMIYKQTIISNKEEDINEIFERIIYEEIKDLEKDIQPFS